jgi:hypothetical protein
LEREFKFFKELEGGVCMMCAPGDLEKSSDSGFEQSRFGASKLTGAVQVATEKRILFGGMVSEPAWVAGGAGVAAQRVIMENADVGVRAAPTATLRYELGVRPYRLIRGFARIGKTFC